MSRFFLGKPVHWLTLVCVAGVLWVVGHFHLHVTQFNLFVVIVLALAAALVAHVVFTHRPGEQPMREPLDDIVGEGGSQ